MYTVFAENHFKNVKFEETYLERGLATFAFNTAIKCKDCRMAYIMDALTGEIICEWDYYKGLSVI